MGSVPGNLVAIAAKLYIKTGDVSLDCIETTTPGQKLNLFVIVKEGYSTRTILMNPAMIPNQGSIDLGSLTQVRRNVW